MIIYSKASQSFLKRLKVLAKSIFKEELGLKLNKRVLISGVYYPLNFVVFEKTNTLGSYNPLLYQIGIHKELMFQADDEALKNILRHELAHFFVHIEYGIETKAHGVEFRDIFNRYGWDKEFSKSSIDMSRVEESSKETNSILQKVQKLLKLAESSNEFEAKLATEKANDLITKHNLENIHETDEDESAYVLRVMSFKRKSSLHDGIYEVLKSFHVYPVFNYGRGGAYLEVIGSKNNVEIADYIANYLETSILKVWKQTKIENPDLKGIVAKNSFIRSFCTSLRAQLVEKERSAYSSKEIVRLNSDLTSKVNIVYPKLRMSYTKSNKTDHKAQMIGSKKGKSFKISKGIGSQIKKRVLTILN